MADPNVIKPFAIERACGALLNADQLSFKTVDASESVFTRTLIHLQGASLPASIEATNASGTADEGQKKFSALKVGNDPVFTPEWQPPTTIKWDDQPPEPEPEEGTAEPKVIEYALFVVLKHRQDWKPTGYGLGELVFTTSLMPDEELTLEMKTWETSRVQQDREDATEQRNTSDIRSSSSESSEAASEVQSKTHEYVDAKAGYSGFGFSASVEAGWSSDVSNLQKDVEKRAQERSQQAASEHRASRKVRVAVSRESGSESKSTRRIKNINQTRTLNANYYEVLREYQVTLTAYEANLVILGAEPDLAMVVARFADVEAKKWNDISLAQMIRYAQSASWVERIIDLAGVSPIKILRELWSRPLFDAALLKLEWWGDADIQILPEERDEFRRTLLRSVRPGPGWLEPDESGALRWAYEVVPGQEKAVLQFLYEYLPYSVQQLKGRAGAAGMRPAAALKALAHRLVKNTSPKQVAVSVLRDRPGKLLGGELPPLELKRLNKLALGKGSALDGTPVGKDFSKTIERWIDDKVMKQISDLRKDLSNAPTTWTTTLPTQGLYGDLSLGVCSGGEDYFEITRQFDLELRRLEVQKLALETEKIRLENERLQQGKPDLSIESNVDGTALNIDVSVGKGPTSVAVSK